MFTFVPSPLRHCLLVLLFSGLFVSTLPAQTAIPAPTPAIPRALPVEKEKKPGFLGRIFKKKATPTPAPASVVAPTATPKPKWKKRPKTPAYAEATPSPTAAEPAADTNPTPNPGLVPLPEAKTIESLPPAPGPNSASANSTPLPSSLPPLVGGSVDNSDDAAPAPELAPVAIAKPTPVPTPTPIALEVRNNPLNQPIPLVDDSMALQITPDATPSPETTAAERAQFQKAKAKALEDAKLRELKAKSEVAASPGERYNALKQYYPRLFASMRKIDGTLEVQIDEMEAASRRRLERMQAEVGNSPAQ